MELPKCADWVKSKEASINGILVALGSVGSYVLRNPEGNLGQFHKTISDLREKQEFIRTMVFKTISMESECKKMVAWLLRIIRMQWPRLLKNMLM